MVRFTIEFLIIMVFGKETHVSEGDRIVGGRDATNIPWIVPMVFARQSGFSAISGLYCAGSIIHEKWVVTAAHCVDNSDPSEWYVLGGVTDLSDVTDAQERKLISIHVHEEYDDWMLTNDIALLELESPFCLDDDVAVIEVATANHSHGVGLEYNVAGWGALHWDPDDWGTEDFPDKLQVLDDFPHYDYDECIQRFIDEYDYITEDSWIYDIVEDVWICAGGYVGEDSCVGDSGGPLWTDVDSNPVLYGIVSWGFDCGTDLPGVYVKISAYQEWIESKIGMFYTDIVAEIGPYIVQGMETATCTDVANPTCTTKIVDEEESWNVRCCADTDPGGWLQNSGCSVYTESNVPRCYKTDYQTAVETCNNVNARLCTKEELEWPSMCTKNSGCGYNSKMIWSSTKATVSKYYIVKGATSGSCNEISDIFVCNTRYVSKNEKWGVRCCAETDPGGWSQEGSCSIYTNSRIPTCMSATDWDSAAGLCSSAGGRLCTREELESDCAKDGGCGLNSDMAWSSTEYTNEFCFVE